MAEASTRPVSTPCQADQIATYPRWFHPTLAECSWALRALERLNARQGQVVIDGRYWVEKLHDRSYQDEWLVSKYVETGNAAWLAIGRRAIGFERECVNG